ncbi:hypothetical protein ACA910_019929 [Epithemia clementina (nom. ined.)]
MNKGPVPTIQVRIHQCRCHGSHALAENVKGSVGFSSRTLSPETTIAEEKKETNDTTTITTTHATGDDAIIVAQQTFDIDEILQSYTQTVARRSTTNGDDKGEKDNKKDNDSITIIAVHAYEQTNGRLLLVLRGHDLLQTTTTTSRNRVGGFLKRSLANSLRGSKSGSGPTYEIFNHLGKSMGRSRGPVTPTNSSKNSTNSNHNHNNPVWKEQFFQLESLCGMSLKAPLRITVHKNDNKNELEYIGNVCLSVQEMLDYYKKRNELPTMSKATQTATNDSGPSLSPTIALELGGSKLPKAALSVVQAELLPDQHVSTAVETTLESVLSSYTNLHKLRALEAVQHSAAQAAQAQADQAQHEAQQAQDQLLSLTDQHKDAQTKLSQLTLQMESMQQNQPPVTGSLQLLLAARNLADLDVGIRNKSDPVYEIFLENQTSSTSETGKTPLVRSNVVRNNLNPTWDEQVLDLSHISGDMEQTKLKIVVSDQDKTGERELLGTISMTIPELVAASAVADCWMDLKNQPKQHKRLLPRPGGAGSSSGKKSTNTIQGQITVLKAQLLHVKHRDEELRHLQKECQLLERKLTEMAPALAKAKTRFEHIHPRAQQATEAATKAQELYEKARQATEKLELSIL